MERDLLIRKASRLRKEGKSIRAIADDLGVHRSSVHRALKSLESSTATSRSDFAGITAADFVGREREFGELASLLADAISGDGRLALLSGEPGIGKTRLAAEFSDLARSRDCLVLWGRSHGNDGSPPYWPWIQALKGLVIELSDQSLADCLGSNGPELANLVPDFQSPGRDLGTVSALEFPRQAKYRLFNAVSSFLQRVSSLKPVVIVLDNLHWTDRDSLLLYQFVANEVDRHRICIVATYRDTDLVFGNNLAEIFDGLPRSPVLRRFTLGRLSYEETSAYLDYALGTRPPQALLDGIFNSTEGNPLFVAETVRMLIQEHGVDGGLGNGYRELAVRIPEGVKEVIGRRINAVSDDAGMLSRVASVIGREFSAAELAHCLVELPDDRFDRTLSEVIAAAFMQEVSEEPGRFRFSHELVRATLYDSLSHRTRADMHLRVADFLAETASDDPAAMSRIAHHYARTARESSASVAIDYLVRAGSAATEASAYEDAQSHLKFALELLDRWQPANLARRGEILLQLGLAQRKSGAFLQARESQAAAAEIARRTGDFDLQTTAAIDFAESGFYPGITGRDAVQILEDVLDRGPLEDTPANARLLGVLSRALIFAGQIERATEKAGSALQMARRIGDVAVLARAVREAIFPMWPRPDLIHERVRMAEELISLARALGDDELLSDAHGFRLFCSLELGQIETVDADIDAKHTIGLRIRSPEILYMVEAWRSMRALLAGDFAEAERRAVLAENTGSRLQAYGVDGVFGLQMFSIRREQGRLGEIAPMVSAMAADGQGGSTWQPGLAVIYSELDMEDEARHVFDSLADDDFAMVPKDALWLVSMSFLADTCAYLRDSARAETLYRMLEPYAGRAASAGSAVVCFGAVDRDMANLAATMTDRERSIAHYESAIELNSAMGAAPWLARTRHDYARALVSFGQGGDIKRVRSLLEQARRSADSMGMTSLVNRCAETRELLLSAGSDNGSVPARLTEREVEVLRLVASGKSNKEIASELVISVYTVGNHVSNILSKTGSSNRAEAATYGLGSGLFSQSDAT